jgi:phosphatidylglycerophosphate synthase/phosphoglycolate phosphatase-like HAD superfamily hydrolase
VSGAVRQLASQGRARVHDLGDHTWIDVDTPRDRAGAERFLSQQSTKSLDGWVSQHLNRPLSRRVFTPLLLRVAPRITPNQVSLVSVAIAVIASLCFFLGQPLAGGIAIQLASVLDGSDGEIARLKKLESPFGGFLDALLDRYGDSFVLFGMAYFAWTASANARLFGDAWTPLIALAATLAIVGTLMVSYSSAKALADFGYRYRGRWVAAGRGRDLRLLLLFLAGVLAVIHPLSVFVALVLIAALTNAIVLRRVWISAGRERGPAAPNGGVRAVVLDFDGTVADTMPFLSDLAVSLLTQHYGVSPQEARRRYRETSGLDFASQVAEMFPGHSANTEVIATFERRKRASILAQPVFPETIQTLRALGQRGIQRFLVSSTPLETLAAYTQRHGIDGWIDGCRGFAPDFDKVRQLESLLAEHDLHPDEVLFVGDSLRDLDVAEGLGIRFLGVHNGFDAAAVRARGLVSVPDLTALTSWLVPARRGV